MKKIGLYILTILALFTSCDNRNKDQEIDRPQLVLLNDDYFTMSKNSVLPLEVYLNDNITDNASLTFSSTTKGQVSFLDNQLVYTPNTDFLGLDTITYEVCLGQNCKMATSIINVVEFCNISAGNDVVSVIKNQELTHNILENDDFCGLFNLSISIPPSNGVATIENNKILYTPNTDYLGSDILQYKLCNTSGTCTDALMSITVTEDCGSIFKLKEDTVRGFKGSGEVLFTRDNLFANDTLCSDDIDDDRFSIIITGLDGDLVINSTNRIFTYIPPSLDYTGTNRFVYRACSKADPGVCDNAIVNIIIE